MRQRCITVFIAVVVIMVVMELIVEYAIKTAIALPWYIIKRECIYEYPPLIAYMLDMDMTSLND